MFDHNDTLHLQELASRYNVQVHPIRALTRIPSDPPSLKSPGFMPKAIKATKTHHFCCGTLAKNHGDAIDHFLESHQPKENRIISMALGFLKGIKHLPSNPSFFRPAPKFKSPLEFRNPYSSSQAMAYDFLDQTQSGEYLSFIQKLGFDGVYEVFPLWATYFYFPEKDETNLDCQSSKRLFPCTLCPKVFRQRHGLKYHFSRNHSRKEPDTFKMYYPGSTLFDCPVASCNSSFFSMSSVRRHITRKHTMPTN